MADADDADRCVRLRAGDATVAAEWLGRDYGVATLFAAVVGSSAEEAFREVIAAVRAGEIVDNLRVRVLAAIYRLAIDRPAELRPLGTFLGPHHPWAGWWDDPPPPWPNGFLVSADHVRAALALLAPEARVLLVLAETAGLNSAQVKRVTGLPPDPVLAVSARKDFVAAVDRVVTGAG